MPLSNFFKKTLILLRAKSLITGLEVSDSALRLAYFHGERLELVSFRLPPGILQAGKIKNREEFSQVLKKFKDQVSTKIGIRGKINAVVCLSSVNIYTQVFSLPYLTGENFEKAVDLNLKMVSPEKSEEIYSGSQVINEDKDKLKIEVLSAFLSRTLVDEMTGALSEAGFFVLAIESRSFAISRLIRKLAIGFDVNKPYAVISLDNNALDFIVLRRGQVYFEYFNFWKDLNAEGREIRYSDFEAAVTGNLHRVLNFYVQHWPEPVTELFLITLGLKDEVIKIVRDNFSLQVKDLKLNVEQAIDPEWFMAVGSSLRGLVSRREDKDVSLMKIGTQEEFREEQVLGFLRFWRVASPVVLGILIIILGGANLFLIKIEGSIEAQPKFQLSEEQSKEFKDLTNRASDFNRSIVLIKDIQGQIKSKGQFLDKLKKLLDDNGINLTQFSFSSFGSPLTLTGEAASTDKILNFKAGLKEDPQFENVDLPITNIKTSLQGFSFSASFSIAAPKIE